MDGWLFPQGRKGRGVSMRYSLITTNIDNHWKKETTASLDFTKHVYLFMHVECATRKLLFWAKSNTHKNSEEQVLSLDQILGSFLKSRQ
jgi:hypothetical protein